MPTALFARLLCSLLMVWLGVGAAAAQQPPPGPLPTPSSTMAEALKGLGTNPAFANLNLTAQGRLYPVQGAVPLMRGTQLFGGVWCSGGSGQQDEDAAKAAAAGF